MRLNMQTDFALRTLMHLAVNRDRRVTIGQISDVFGMSKNHLMKVAQTLSREGFISSERGRNGGLSLARAPSDIFVGDVVRKMEGNAALVSCFPGGAGGCLITPACRLRGALAEAQDAFFRALDSRSIADLVDGNAPLHGLLDIGEAA
ncbi:Rrf2 family transcriptional regulator [Hyphomonas johnsonii]|jgi:Rrf2 family nitric oxide-sensitive transcriptional repressor|uniref:Transcriptional regulator n=1 Tax=Hyphomonas johnsonii MHS-2 TaxID=1280950 RepID=A0A059FPA1_9PROT|nr:Rrf2 family transcriptional regulator [Hyphomonas johnsonii]KCZ92356.1 transcriptional regulator [Hyphomonas johnsonii MHS-2]